MLDKQIRDTVKQFAHVAGRRGADHRGAELLKALEDGKKIIITTVQKFPFVVEVEALGENRSPSLSTRRTPQSGKEAGKMNMALASETGKIRSATGEDDGEQTPEDRSTG